MQWIKDICDDQQTVQSGKKVATGESKSKENSADQKNQYCADYRIRDLLNTK
jgi:hypothetical protein